MKCKKVVVLFATILLVAFHVKGQSPEQLANQAAKEYNQMHFAKAIELYAKVIDSGNESYALYYNIGNAYYRNNEIAQAALYYEKALKLSPNNDDIKHNIEVVNNRLTDKVEKIPDLFYKRWWAQLLNVMDINTLAVVNIILLTLALILIALYFASSDIIIRKISFWAGVAFLCIFSLGVITASQRNKYLTEQHEAIVFAQTVNIKSSPDENSKDIFVLHEGTKVVLLDIVADWQEIRISNGSVGWIKLSDLKKI